MGKEFTKTDKIIYLLNYAWTGFWTIVFIIGTIYNLSNDVSNASWMSFWKNYLYVHIVVSLFIIVWFTLGGLNDLKVMLTKLKTEYRDHQDDGWVNKEKINEQKETEVVLQRIENWYARLPELVVYNKQEFNAEYGWSKEPTSFKSKGDLKYKKKKRAIAGVKNGRVLGFI